MIIYKYQLTKPVNEFAFDKDSQILSIEEQSGKIVMYVLHIDKDDPLKDAAQKKKRKIAVIGTGLEFDYTLGAFIGSVKLQEGKYMFHVFEVF